MRRTKKKIAVMGIILLLGGYARASVSRTYKGQEAKFEITFPTEFEESTEKRNEAKVISLSCTYKSMILLVSAFVYEEVIPEGDYALHVTEGIVVTADALNSKFNKKKCELWEGAGKNPGLRNAIKGKVPTGSGGNYRLFGNIYICMAYGIEYRITALSTNKKGFDPGIESRFINSFRLN